MVNIYYITNHKKLKGFDNAQTFLCRSVMTYQSTDASQQLTDDSAQSVIN